MYVVEIKESKYSEAGCLITLYYFKNNSPNIISNLVFNWAGNNILSEVYSVSLGINLQWIPTPYCLQSTSTICTYVKKQNTRQVHNGKYGNYDPT